MPFKTRDDGIHLSIRLQPKAAANRIDGIETMADGTRRLRARVRPAPDKGKANKALLGLLAAQFGIAVSRMRLLRGQTSRNKTILILADGVALARWRRQFEEEEKG